MYQDKEENSIVELYQRISQQVAGGLQYLRGELIDDQVPLLDQQYQFSQYLSILNGFTQLLSGDFAQIKFNEGYLSSVFQRGNEREIATLNTKIEKALNSYIKDNVLPERSLNALEEAGFDLQKTFLTCFAYPSGLYPKSDDVTYGGAFVDFSFYNNELLESANIDSTSLQILATAHTQSLLESDQTNLIPEEHQSLIPLLLEDMKAEIYLDKQQLAAAQKLQNQYQQERAAAERVEQERVAAEQERLENWLKNDKAAIYSLTHTDSFISLTNKIASATLGIEELVDKDLVNHFTSTAQLGLSIDYAQLGGNNGYSTVLASSINFVDKNTNLFDFENQFKKCIAKGAASSILTAAVFSPAAGAVNAASSTARCLITKYSPEITSTLGVLSPPIFNLLTQGNDRHIAEKITDVVRIADIATEELTIEYISGALESITTLALGVLGYTHTDEL